MFRHPALVLAQIGRDAQRKALFAQKHVAAVTGIDRPDGVILGEMQNVAFAFVDIRSRVQAFDEIAVLAHGFQNVFAHPGHDGHVQYDVDAVREFDAAFGEFAAHDAHGIGYNVHGSALHGAFEDLARHFIGGRRIHPVVDGAGVFLVFAADKRSVLYARNVVDGGSVEKAFGEKILVEPDHFARGASLRAQIFDLLFAAVYPDDLVGLTKRRALVDKLQNLLVVGHCHCYISFFQRI